ncbi:Aan1p NDAI_0C00440 [Naumovozyma dairenensis CBS 421]|uniref:Uncharacterized protein n=1 Tax=Naumovozyma dairenensis (strain ATCC 10597 / BCRC 20456 / CBS 421 / NBRC 0211 / NRRL Y-12639) TaxID=1071378 RepID=G0W7E4_NAUDC|nr:hypothetical protein NDAI_0C00440 [Naumovozyma dairenensis CBS 421]CCD23705.1 hypothetical protein NDAI_0C00440 [Naumovozyma dairenensis CBS 421]
MANSKEKLRIIEAHERSPVEGKGPVQDGKNTKSNAKSKDKKKYEQNERRSRRCRKRPLFNFQKDMQLKGTYYDVITSVKYINEKYGLRESYYVEKFIKCIHRKINHDVSRISDHYVNSLSPWVKVKFFFLLVTLCERGGPEYWFDKSDESKEPAKDPSSTNVSTLDSGNSTAVEEPAISSKNSDTSNGIAKESSSTNEDFISILKNSISPEFTLSELIMKQNINPDYNESTHDENYLYSSTWANFMEGLINHYLEKVIIPSSELKVCQQLYKPMMKIISLYNEYNELMEKSERNGFLSTPKETNSESTPTTTNDGEECDTASKKDSLDENEDVITQERLDRAQKLLWQAREDIPKTISKELTMLSEMYQTLSADEQDYELDEFVCCAEEYIETEYVPCLINVLFANCGTVNFWKIMLVLEPFFYYIEDLGEEDDDDEIGTEEPFDITGSTVITHNDTDANLTGAKIDNSKRVFSPDPRVMTLEKICKVAAKQKWI